MSIDEPIVIDLKRFGGEGYIEMMEPTLRAQRERDNKIANLVFSVDKNGNIVKNTNNNIDAVFIRVLSYVESAPFKTDLDSFFEYTDELDKKKRGSGTKLYEEMCKAVDTISNGGTSPSADSPEAESGSSA